VAYSRAARPHTRLEFRPSLFGNHCVLVTVYALCFRTAGPTYCLHVDKRVLRRNAGSTFLVQFTSTVRVWREHN
jgi:hypothetical protein